MKALVLFDLHYEDDPSSRRKLDSVVSTPEDFDAVLLGGDNAELSNGLHNHRVLFGTLRDRFNCPHGFVLGNHELWGRIANISSKKLLEDIFPKLGEEYGFTYLERANLTSQGITFVGTYGHFDYSFLRKNTEISRDLLEGGIFVREGRKITWQDIHLMDWEGRNNEEVCRELVDEFERRLRGAKSEKKVTISHTLPRLALNSWPDSPEQRFMEAYSGSDLIGNVLERNPSLYHFCGHTHRRAVATIGKTEVLNVGADYNLLKYAILSIDSDKPKVREIPGTINSFQLEIKGVCDDCGLKHNNKI